MTEAELLARVVNLLGEPPAAEDDPRAAVYSKAANLATAACSMLALGHVSRAVETLQLVAAVEDRPDVVERWRALAAEVATGG